MGQPGKTQSPPDLSTCRYYSASQYNKGGDEIEEETQRKHKRKEGEKKREETNRKGAHGVVTCQKEFEIPAKTRGFRFIHVKF